MPLGPIWAKVWPARMEFLISPVPGTLEAGQYGALVLGRGESAVIELFGHRDASSGTLRCFGGTVVPKPALIVPRPVDSLGFDRLDYVWPEGVSSGASLFFQTLVVDATAPQGWAFSNAVEARTP